ncbi:hypothetical protein CVD28_01650 [Bacillus sp. M6-12]|uniref:hypothetical protein n=1 Tax=Bacillus sp. M6-12 TaxID=2054166 RepID=UPI000C794898|nr:hypothetical protein [Bacillus sp. M6-12]PLS19138.1 hypothetical protein CVD28_01650 [Bacillus sp. M6-12]
MMIQDGLLILEEHDYDNIGKEVKAGKKVIKVVKAELNKYGYELFQVQNMSINRDPKYFKLSMKVSKALQQEILKDRNKKMRFR